MGRGGEGRGKGGRNGRGGEREGAGTGCSRMGADCGRERLVTLMSRVLECQRRAGTTGDHARSSISRVVGIKTRMASRVGASEGKQYGAGGMFREVFGEILL